MNKKEFKKELERLIENMERLEDEAYHNDEISDVSYDYMNRAKKDVDSAIIELRRVEIA